MAETAKERLTRGYAFSIYIDGMRTFASTSTSYHAGIKAYAAGNFTKAQIDNAYANGWITQVEYDETLAIKYPDGNIPVTETFDVAPPTEEV